MFDERAFIERVESAGVDELAAILARPTAEQERALRVHFGDERYERMHRLALEQAAESRDALTVTPPKGNVVVIHGIMGGELSSFDSPASSSLIWVSKWRLFRGWAGRLMLGDDGRAGAHQVRATGIITDYYGEMLLKLRAEKWDVRAFWFDWRLDIRASAEQLHAKINEWFGAESPVHIVAHSMGGLVARSFIKMFPARWRAMWDSQNNGLSGGRLVMLGTPNYGSYIIPQVVTGLEPTVRMLALVDIVHGLKGVLKIINTFPGSYQMLPSPIVAQEAAPLYEADTYGEHRVAQRHLDDAREFHEWLSTGAVDEERMIYVAGYNRPTLAGVADYARLASPDAYEVTRLGDGRVTHALGVPRVNGRAIKRVYYIDEDHSELPRNQEILSLLNGLLLKGATDALETAPPASMRAVPTEEEMSRDRAELARRQNEQVERFRASAARLQLSRSATPPALLLPEERVIREGLISGFVPERSGGKDVTAMTEKASAKTSEQASEPARVEIRLRWGGIEEVGVDEANGRPARKTKTRGDGLPVDAVAVGHYVGVGRPLMAEQALDKAISRALFAKAPKDAVPETERLLTLYAERGIVRGELGQPFFLADPRSNDGRVIALAGMGVPGRFGVPELVVLARELCWSLGRMKKRHLATVLIGAGKGNLSEPEAVAAWVRGIKYALTNSEQDERWRLRRMTFVEFDPTKIERLQQAIQAAIETEAEIGREIEEGRRSPQEQWLKIDYEPLNLAALSRDGKTLAQAVAAANRAAAREREDGFADKQNSSVPTRVTLGLQGRKYRFGAITETASVPEREVPLDPALVVEANSRLTRMGDLHQQLDWGRYLEKLLLPDDLRAAFTTNAPVVMMLDATTARIHWEMLALSEVAQPGVNDSNEVLRGSPLEYFLSTSRGFTRQLRTGFAPPPEPPPPPRRLLRVLVVADPAEDAPLPGAEKEGREVAEIFRAFNEAYVLPDYRVEVVTLFGPAEATRTDVLYHLTRRGPYDILHFAGHCVYDATDPSLSGWIFTKGARLSANELNRIDHVPKFVFSNACESGITPARAEARSDQLAPSFAEAFFARGVANFVCTAWPVGDAAAREFAAELYGRLLGLRRDAETNRYVPDPEGPQPMHAAMREARMAIASAPHGVRTWGAYQHYGNPYLQFFDREKLRKAAGGALTTDAAERQREPAAKKRRGGKRRSEKG
jgi:pimeloyl-ACP methyl ester carboxylesterase